jgi:hypothetical protein
LTDIIWIVPAASIVAALIVTAGNTAVQRWRYRVDRLASSIDLLCSEINAAADLATDYWLKQAPLGDRLALGALEALLLGRQNRLQEIRIALGENDVALILETVDMHLVDLFDAMTGGNFQVDGRPIDADRARLVQARAAVLNGDLRRALASRLWRQWWQ